MFNIWKIPRYWPTNVPSLRSLPISYYIETRVKSQKNPRKLRGSLSLAPVVSKMSVEMSVKSRKIADNLVMSVKRGEVNANLTAGSLIWHLPPMGNLWEWKICKQKVCCKSWPEGRDFPDTIDHCK